MSHENNENLIYVLLRSFPVIKYSIPSLYFCNATPAVYLLLHIAKLKMTIQGQNRMCKCEHLNQKLVDKEDKF